MTSGNSPVPSYKDEFKHGVNLFERSLDAYKKSTNDNQKAAFKEVMDKASHVMDETAPLCLNSSGQQKYKQLMDDYRNFSQNASSEMMKKLQGDINALKKSV